ncbi:hypothetical protein ACFL96_14005 [Thermoproteota archaeon]
MRNPNRDCWKSMRGFAQVPFPDKERMMITEKHIRQVIRMYKSGEVNQRLKGNATIEFYRYSNDCIEIRQGL